MRNTHRLSLALAAGLLSLGLLAADAATTATVATSANVACTARSYSSCTAPAARIATPSPKFVLRGFTTVARP